MIINRVIPCLLVENGRLVKTEKFAKAKYVGDPVNAIRIFNQKEVDELIVLDIGASKAGRTPDYDLISQIAGECFMPICYGGGVRSVDEATRILKLGVEKICIQTAALKDATLIEALADRFGSQAVVASIDVKRDWRGRPKLYSAAQKRNLKTAWRAHLKAMVAAGAGEIVLNAVDRDGTQSGTDVELITAAASDLDVPLIAMGGVGSLADVRTAVNAGADAVGAGAFFVFNGPHKAVLITYPKYEELERLLGTAF